MKQTVPETTLISKPVSEEWVAQMFNRIARRYDFLNRLLSARQDQRWRKFLASRIAKKPGGKLCDVATGTGDVLLQVAAAHPEYASFLGVDISDRMLDFAREKARQEPRASFQLMSATDLKVESTSMDCVTISFGIRNVIDRVKALSEFYRVLKPDGELFVLEFFTPDKGVLGSLFRFYFRRLLPLIGKVLSDASAYKYLPESVMSFDSLEAFSMKMQEAGFQVNIEKKFLFGACILIKGRRSY